MSTDTTTTTESTRVAVRQEMSWTDPSLSDLPDRGWVTPVALLVLAAGATSVDVLVMYPAIARAMGHSPVQSWLTAIGLGLLALVAAGMAGWTWRGARGNHPGSRAVLLLPSLLMLAWLALGVLIMTLRMQVSEVSTTVNFEGVEQQTSTSESGFDLVAAGVFIAVHVLCGVLVFSDMYHWRNDAYRAGRQALDRLKRTRQALAAREGMLARPSSVHLRPCSVLPGLNVARGRLRSEADISQLVKVAGPPAHGEKWQRRAGSYFGPSAVQLSLFLSEPSATGTSCYFIGSLRWY